VIKRLLCTGVLLLSATALRADVFSFSYAGVGVQAAGTLTATLGFLGYNVTNIYGTRNGTAFDASPIGAGLFTYSPSSYSGSIAFSLGSLGLLNTVTFSNGDFAEVGLTGVKTGTNFSISRVPELATMLLLFTMGLGVWVLARKLPYRNTRQS